MDSLRLVILGRQGSGKGTQCARLVKSYGPVHVSTGDMLRTAVTTGTELGHRVSAIMEAGELVPDGVMNEIVAERLSNDDIADHGLLLDGYPRTPSQAVALTDVLEATGTHLDLALNLEVPAEEATRRMLDRGRTDDTEEAIVRRLSLYEIETAPLIAWFEERGLLATVDGLGSEDEVFERLSRAIHRLTGTPNAGL
ncbi:MAG: adenylate kinase [Actinomycetota bacterium]|nr:adenylate kinase [Actinomycetota bacterium]